MVNIRDRRQYARNLGKFVRYHYNDPNWEDGVVPTLEQWGQIGPNDVRAWLNFVTFGQPEDPEEMMDDGDDDAAPPQVALRSTTLEYYKKSISFFHPMKRSPWNPLAKVGNPTLSQEVNEVIEYVRKLEVRKRGRPPKATRAFEMGEYTSIQDTIMGQADEIPMAQLYGYTAYMAYSFAMIARIDDTSHLKKAHFCRHPHFPRTALRTRLHWSKNVMSERRCYWQILLGAMNAYFCVLLQTAAFLEMHHADVTNDPSPFLFSFTQEQDNEELACKQIKRKMSDALKKAIQENDHIDPNILDIAEDGTCGSHSIRKFAGGHVVRCGLSAEYKEYRGRWSKGKSRVSTGYQHTELPFVDAVVCSTLCVGGACSYVLKEPTTDAFVTTFVTPNVTRVFGETVGLVLGGALLWAVFDPDQSAKLPPALTTDIRDAYNNTFPDNQLEDGENPVEKRPLVVSGHEGQVVLTEIGGGAPGVGHAADNNPEQPGQPAPPHVQANIMQPPGGVQHVGATGGITQGQMAAVMALQADQTRAVTDLSNVLQNFRGVVTERFDQVGTSFSVVNANIRRLARHPRFAVAVANGNPAAPAAPAVGANNNNNNPAAGAAALPPPQNNAPAVPHIDPNATLAPRLRSLHDLWTEYIVGIGTRRAAHSFTAAERGRCKHKYSRRKKVWMVVSSLVGAGISAQVAIDRIYAVYGEASSVTYIINRLGTDINNGTLHPSLIPP